MAKEEDWNVTVEDMLPGAQNAVKQCMAVNHTDRVFIFSDSESKIIGEALAEAARRQGASVHLALLEDFAPRPILTLPNTLKAAVTGFHPTVTFYAARSYPGEIRMRIPLNSLLQHELKVRHGHMIGITPLLMRTGMLADYQRVSARTMEVYQRVKNAREFIVKNNNGTDFHAVLDPGHLRWQPWTGLYHQQETWGNLPEGETFTSPASCEGTLTASVLGDYFSEKYGLLDHPVTLEVADSRLIRVEHPNKDLASEIWNYLSSVENGRRVGEFAVGTNEQLKELTGNLLQDEKIPGVHVAFGNPYNDFTGATWTSPIHVDVIPVKVSAWVDGEQLLDQGCFTF